jgi:hypothetical protein
VVRRVHSSPAALKATDARLRPGAPGSYSFGAPQCVSGSKAAPRIVRRVWHRLSK